MSVKYVDTGYTTEDYIKKLEEDNKSLRCCGNCRHSHKQINDKYYCDKPYVEFTIKGKGVGCNYKYWEPRK